MKAFPLFVATLLLSLSAWPMKAEEPCDTPERLVDQLPKASQTLRDMRSIRWAVEVYGFNNDYFPRATSMEELEALLVPDYMVYFPAKDAWGSPFHYEVTADAQSYTIASRGADGRLEPWTWNSSERLDRSSDDAVMVYEGIERIWITPENRGQ